MHLLSADCGAENVVTERHRAPQSARSAACAPAAASVSGAARTVPGIGLSYGGGCAVAPGGMPGTDSAVPGIDQEPEELLWRPYRRDVPSSTTSDCQTAPAFDDARAEIVLCGGLTPMGAANGCRHGVRRGRVAAVHPSAQLGGTLGPPGHSESRAWRPGENSLSRPRTVSADEVGALCTPRSGCAGHGCAPEAAEKAASVATTRGKPTRPSGAPSVHLLSADCGAEDLG